MTLCDKGREGIFNFVTSHFRNSIKGDIIRINQIQTIQLKSIEHCTLNNLNNIHVMTFNVHLAQFDVAPTRNLIISSVKLQNM